ncbi:hypothetical protein ED733_000381 [Metarhizium rileyi]|uniref:Peptidase A1 domain-containing protein n=1 Tax=Metarhizium rileyi (strain RCEF 4871) TaxID=1649241 RepID=A0A5C6GIG2_METRR|nr:hypothetical protein ED733_000381 [Metarhizium rileyi]
MKATTAAVLLAALVDNAIAEGVTGNTPQARTPKANGKSFTLDQVENKNFKGHDGPMSFLRAHIKYAQKLPDYLSKVVEKNPALRLKFSLLAPAGFQTGTVEAQPSEIADTEYSINVEIGTPPQIIPLNLDTGSADFWVFSTDTNPSMVNGQQLYDASKSSTSQFLPNETWGIKYGDNAQASGNVYTDRVQIGSTYVDKQAVQVATNVTEDLTQDNFVSGILGMANSAANTVRPTPQRTYIDNIKNDLALPLFTANLKRRAAGNYNFGYINDLEYTGDIAYTPIDRTFPLWSVFTTGYKIGSSRHNASMSAIVDTGTSLLLLPEDVVSRYYAKVPGSGIEADLGMVVFPCNATLPDFHLLFNKYRGRVPGSYMNYGQISSRYCFGGLQSSAALPFSVLGDVFLKAQFVVFDYGNAAVGFANKDLGE